MHPIYSIFLRRRRRPNGHFYAPKICPTSNLVCPSVTTWRSSFSPSKVVSLYSLLLPCFSFVAYALFVPTPWKPNGQMNQAYFPRDGRGSCVPKIPSKGFSSLVFSYMTTKQGLNGIIQIKTAKWGNSCQNVKVGCKLKFTLKLAYKFRKWA
jgi:hypothetical protein